MVIAILRSWLVFTLCDFKGYPYYGTKPCNPYALCLSNLQGCDFRKQIGVSKYDPISGASILQMLIERPGRPSGLQDPTGLFIGPKQTLTNTQLGLK
jgi:hypothetical protein